MELTKEIKEEFKKLLRAVLIGVTLGLLIRFSPSEKLVRILVPISLISGVVALWPRRRETGTKVAFIGAAANLLVILANKGLMPVQRSKIGQVRKKSKRLERAEQLPTGSWIKGSHAFVDEDKAHLNLLSDRIALNARGVRGVASIGDLILFLGIIASFAEALRSPFKTKKTAPKSVSF